MFGHSAFHLAAAIGDERVLSALLESSTNGIPSGCLHAATSSRNTGALALLLAHGADVDSCDVGTTPVHMAVLHANHAALTLPIDAGANVNSRTHFGDLPRRPTWQH